MDPQLRAQENIQNQQAANPSGVHHHHIGKHVYYRNGEAVTKEEYMASVQANKGPQYQDPNYGMNTQLAPQNGGAQAAGDKGKTNQRRGLMENRGRGGGRGGGGRESGNRDYLDRRDARYTTRGESKRGRDETRTSSRTDYGRRDGISLTRDDRKSYGDKDRWSRNNDRRETKADRRRGAGGYEEGNYYNDDGSGYDRGKGSRSRNGNRRTDKNNDYFDRYAENNADSSRRDYGRRERTGGRDVLEKREPSFRRKMSEQEQRYRESDRRRKRPSTRNGNQRSGGYNGRNNYRQNENPRRRGKRDIIDCGPEFSALTAPGKTSPAFNYQDLIESFNEHNPKRVYGTKSIKNYDPHANVSRRTRRVPRKYEEYAEKRKPWDDWGGYGDEEEKRDEYEYDRRRERRKSKKRKGGEKRKSSKEVQYLDKGALEVLRNKIKYTDYDDLPEEHKAWLKQRGMLEEVRSRAYEGKTKNDWSDRRSSSRGKYDNWEIRGSSGRSTKRRKGRSRGKSSRGYHRSTWESNSGSHKEFTSYEDYMKSYAEHRKDRSWKKSKRRGKRSTGHGYFDTEDEETSRHHHYPPVIVSDERDEGGRMSDKEADEWADNYIKKREADKYIKELVSTVEGKTKRSSSSGRKSSRNGKGKDDDYEANFAKKMQKKYGNLKTSSKNKRKKSSGDYKRYYGQNYDDRAWNRGKPRRKSSSSKRRKNGKRKKTSWRSASDWGRGRSSADDPKPTRLVNVYDHVNNRPYRTFGWRRKKRDLSSAVVERFAPVSGKRFANMNLFDPSMVAPWNAGSNYHGGFHHREKPTHTSKHYSIHHSADDDHSSHHSSDDDHSSHHSGHSSHGRRHSSHNDHSSHHSRQNDHSRHHSSHHLSHKHHSSHDDHSSHHHSGHHSGHNHHSKHDSGDHGHSSYPSAHSSRERNHSRRHSSGHSSGEGYSSSFNYFYPFDSRKSISAEQGYHGSYDSREKKNLAEGSWEDHSNERQPHHEPEKEKIDVPKGNPDDYVKIDLKDMRKRHDSSDDDHHHRRRHHSHHSHADSHHHNSHDRHHHKSHDSHRSYGHSSGHGSHYSPDYHKTRRPGGPISRKHFYGRNEGAIKPLNDAPYEYDEGNDYSDSRHFDNYEYDDEMLKDSNDGKSYYHITDKKQRRRKQKRRQRHHRRVKYGKRGRGQRRRRLPKTQFNADGKPKHTHVRGKTTIVNHGTTRHKTQSTKHYDRGYRGKHDRHGSAGRRNHESKEYYRRNENSRKGSMKIMDKYIQLGPAPRTTKESPTESPWQRVIVPKSAKSNVTEKFAKLIMSAKQQLGTLKEILGDNGGPYVAYGPASERESGGLKDDDWYASGESQNYDITPFDYDYDEEKANKFSDEHYYDNDVDHGSFQKRNTGVWEGKFGDRRQTKAQNSAEELLGSLNLLIEREKAKSESKKDYHKRFISPENSDQDYYNYSNEIPSQEYHDGGAPQSDRHSQYPSSSSSSSSYSSTSSYPKEYVNPYENYPQNPLRAFNVKNYYPSHSSEDKSTEIIEASQTHFVKHADPECDSLDGVFPIKGNCAMFFVCMKGEVTGRYMCPRGLTFDGDKGICSSKRKGCVD